MFEQSVQIVDSIINDYADLGGTDAAPPARHGNPVTQ